MFCTVAQQESWCLDPCAPYEKYGVATLHECYLSQNASNCPGRDVSGRKEGNNHCLLPEIFFCSD